MADKEEQQQAENEAAKQKAKAVMQSALEDDGEDEEQEEGMIQGAEDPLNKQLMQSLVDSDKNVLDQVKIYSPFKVYFDAEALSVSAENRTGAFDILPGHKNFMTLLTPCEVVVRTKGGAERLRIERGVMHVRDNKIIIFLDV